MKYVFYKLVLILFSILLLQCQKERDAYYEEPDWMGKSIHETLKDKGNFDLYLELADRTDYSISLKGNGFWTVFAPVDDAMQQWLSQKGYGSVKDVPKKEADKIVAYSLLFNQYRIDQLSHILNVTWDSLQSVKKRTAYYETIHKELYKGDSIWVISPTERIPLPPVLNDNNYKYIPFYMDAQFRKQSLDASDYKLFYPNSNYTGKNVQQATILEENIFASNGVIHSVDKINEPLPNFEDILKEPQYSKYMNLIQLKDARNEPEFYSYAHYQSITEYYQKMFPSLNIDRVYVKMYNNLALSINNERYINIRSSTTTDHEKGGYTMFVPNNDGVQKFFDEKLSDYYTSLDEVPVHIWQSFINAQMCDELVYPGMFHRKENVNRDFLNGEGLYGPRFNDVKGLYMDIRPASNGFFYGGNAYISNREFESVLTEVTLNTKYDYMEKAFSLYFSTSLASELTNSKINGFEEKDFSLLLIPDELLKSEAETPGQGFNWGWSGGGSSSNEEREQFYHGWDNDAIAWARDRMQRMVRSHIFCRSKSSTLNGANNFRYGDQVAYQGYGYVLNEYGDMVRYRNGELQMIGNYEKGVLSGYPTGEWVKVDKKKDFLNGTVYTTDKLLQYSVCSGVNACQPQTVQWYLDHAVTLNSDISESVRYLKCLININRIPIADNVPYTFLLPNNAAISDAKAKGLLPALNPDGTFWVVDDAGKNTDIEDIQRINPSAIFFNYHVIQGLVFLDDNQEKIIMSNGDERTEYKAPTLHRLMLSGTYLRVLKRNNRLVFTDDARFAADRREASVRTGYTRSNLFAPRGVIHEINQYFIPPTE